MESRASREKRESFAAERTAGAGKNACLFSIGTKRENQPLYIPETRGES